MNKIFYFEKKKSHTMEQSINNNKLKIDFLTSVDNTSLSYPTRATPKSRCNYCDRIREIFENNDVLHML